MKILRTLSISLLTALGLLLSSCGSGGSSSLLSVDPDSGSPTPAPGSPSQPNLPTTLSFVVQIGSSYGDPATVDRSAPLGVTVRFN